MKENAKPAYRSPARHKCTALDHGNVQDFFEGAGFECHTPSYRWHDLPEGDARIDALTGASIADYVEDIAHYVKEMDRRPIVIGHSLGG